MPVVIDSSIASAWALPDEFSAVADAALAALASTEMLVPQLFWYEVRNVLVVNERRRRIDRLTTATALAFMGTLRQSIDANHNEDVVLTLARKHQLSVYDACYLELAIRSQAPLATLDARLARAAETEAIRLVSA